MRRLGPLFALALALGSCGGEDPPPPPTTPVTGGLHLTWRFVNGSGMALDCETALIEQVSIDIGRTPTVRPCTDGQMSFGALLPDRYPVIARALTVQGTPRATLMTNGEVVAGSTRTVDLAFVVDREGGLTGELVVHWRVDSRDPRTGCGVAGADIAHVVAGTGSIDTFDEKVPCTDAEVTIHDLRPGVYVPQVRLETLDGTRVAIGIGEAVRVVPDVFTDTANINVVTMTGPATRLVAQWTVNSTAAVDACSTVQGRNVTFTTVPRNGLVPTSTTVACERGSAILSQGLGAGDIDVRLTLAYGPASVTSTIVPDVHVIRGRTATVTYDFRAE